jgi:G protein-coupled glucose receptor regulating Gpa2 C-term
MRLGTHYIWIFLIQGLCIILYGALFWKLSVARKTISSMNKTVTTNDQRIKRAALLMAIYPVVYVGLTLPLAASRMALYAHRSVPVWAWVFSGTLMTSSGWVDCVLYAFTRRALLKEEFKASPHSRHSYGEGTNWLHRHHGHKHDSTDMFGASIQKSFYTSTEKVDADVHISDLSSGSGRGRMSDRTGFSNDSATAVDPHSPPRSPSQVRLKHNSADIELGTFYHATAGDGERDEPENSSMSSESPIILQRSNSRGSKKGSRKTSEDNLNHPRPGNVANARREAQGISVFRKSSRASSPTPQPAARITMARRQSPPRNRTGTPDRARVVEQPHQYQPSSSGLGPLGGITVNTEVNVQSRPKSEVSNVSNPNSYFQSGAWAKLP